MRASRKAEPLAMYFALGYEPRQARYGRRHVEGYNSLVKYLVKLRREGTLDDGDFAELVKLASAAFVEAEVSERVEHVLDGKKLEESLLRFIG